MERKGFESFNIDDSILRSIKDLGYEKPSEVQAHVIPLALKDNDIVVKSQTGSGKTAAFAIPICERVDIEEKAPQALILTPTRELAVQVKEDITSIGRYRKVRCAAVFGKQPMELQIRELKQRVHVIVGTPGRVLDHIDRENIKLEKIKYLVLDEADEMLSMGFIDQVEAVINSVPKDRITMLFSATLPEAIERLCNKYMINPQKIEINPDKLTVEKIDQLYYQIAEDDKFELLNRVLYIENPDSCIIFCRTKDKVDYLAAKLKGRGYPAMEIHGGMVQQDRLETMRSFKRGEFRILVATDVAARGIDVEEITHVINYDLPLEKESYVHRIGRTGRAGSQGRAITFVTPYEDKFLLSIEEYIDMKIPKEEIPSREDAEENKGAFLEKNRSQPRIKEQRASKVNKDIMKIYINAGKKKKIRPGDLVGAISSINGIQGNDIGIIDILDNVSYVEILNGKGKMVLEALRNINVKGKPVRVEKASR